MHKIENLEQNLSKIEENSSILPEIEQKLAVISKQNEQKFALIEKSAFCVENQFDIAINSLPYVTKPGKTDFKFFELNEKELEKLDQSLLQLLKKLEFSKNIQCLVEGFCKALLIDIEAKFEKPFLDTLSHLDSKLTKANNAISILSMKLDMHHERQKKLSILKSRSKFAPSVFQQIENKENLACQQNFSSKVPQKEVFLQYPSLWMPGDIGSVFRKLEEYRTSFRKFYEDLTLVLKGFLQWKSLKPEEVRMLKAAADSRGDLARQLEGFLAKHANVLAAVARIY